MKQKILTMILLVGITASVFTGCGQTENASTAINQTAESTEQPEAAETKEETEALAETPEPTEEPHTHNYTETITTEASCEKAGLKTYTCECGDTYTEEISATGHVYENYVSNEDATYLADGTETAKCNTCDLTDTRTSEGSKLEYTYTDMEATMYAQQTVNVRDLPSIDGNKVGSLSANDEVKVTGQTDNGWYRIEYNDSVAYVSDSYLGENKVEAALPVQENAQTTSSVPNPYDYPVSTWIDMGDWFFYVHPDLGSPEPNVNGALWEDVRAILQERYPDRNISGRSGMKLDNGTYTVWVIAVGGTHSYDYPKALLDFIVKYQG